MIQTVKQVTINDTTFFLTYCDATHFFLSNNEEFKGHAYHIGQFRSESCYNEVNEWLRQTHKEKIGQTI